MRLTLRKLTFAVVAALATASPTLAAGPESGATLPVAADYHLGLGDKLLRSGNSRRDQGLAESEVLHLSAEAAPVKN